MMKKTSGQQKSKTNRPYFAFVFQFDFFAFNLVIDRAKISFWQILGIVDTAVHLNILFFRHFVLDVGAVQIRGEHDDGIRKYVSRVRTGENFCGGFDRESYRNEHK